MDEDEGDLEITEADFLEAIEGFQPSVTAQDLKYYKSVKDSMKR